tara:strand:+ start:67 stop:3183 length:3117 start_codon:yes stop_codon:yes gene_type:complete
MPKETYNIKQFQDGLNNNSNPRDLKDTEIADITDGMVDELGQIRAMGGNAAHSTVAARANQISPGYGLHQFSTDRTAGQEIQIGNEILNNTTIDNSSHWTLTGSDLSFQYSSEDAFIVYTYSSGGDTFISQTASDRKSTGIGQANYTLTYSTSNLSGSISTFQIWSDNDADTEFSNTTTNLSTTNGNNKTVTFDAHADAAANHFRIKIAGSVGASIRITYLSLKRTGTASTDTGEDYIACSEPNTSGTVDIYSSGANTWGIPITGMNNNTSGFRKDIFYDVDGALRVCDSDFGNTNASMWYGYIDRVWFPNTSGGVTLSEWYPTTQAIAPPSASHFNDSAIISPSTEATYLIDTQVTAGSEYKETRSNISTVTDGGNTRFDAGSGTQKIAYVDVPITFTTFVWGYASVTIKAGPYDTTGGWGAGAEEVSTSFLLSPGTNNNTLRIYFDPSLTDTSSDWADGGGTDEFRVKLESSSHHTGAILTTTISSTAIKIYELSNAVPILDSDADAIGYLTGNNSYLSIGWNNGGGSGWESASSAGTWKIATSLIYDESQESLLTELSDQADGTTKTFSTDGHGGDGAMHLFIAVADPSHNGDGSGDGTLWNKRVTGMNIYVQDVKQDENQTWHLLGECNFLTGILKVTNTQKKYNAEFNGDSSNQRYFYWNLSHTELSSPPNTITYEMSSGLSDSEDSIDARYKTAVVANRRTYIGNVKIIRSNSEPLEEIRSDAIIKSPVNSFDVFPSKSIIEASIRDGDEIIKLEEYADRLLQFKKKKMQIINISQQVEFLEDTYMHKGVLHPAAVCKTDYGIAWVNRQGCYAYDGKTVKDLLEKGGVQIISESAWESFTTDNSIIGYLPKKRQLIVLKDCSATSSVVGDIYLFDMVTQSWTKGDSKFADNEIQTNFITDWNADLVHVYDTGTGTVHKWSDAGVSSGTFLYQTKEIDFGQPSQRKKVYKVYVTYTGGSGQNCNIQYRKDGIGSWLDFDGTLNDSATTQTIKELKPNASINNIKSLELKISGTVATTFELDDISIVFRRKPIK